MNNNPFLRSLLVVLSLGVLSYTLVAFSNEGPNLFPVFLNDALSGTWRGQFNVDFTSYLILSGIWIMWRNKFKPSSIVIGMVASIVGIIVFAPYVLYLLTKENGDVRKVLVGENA